ncbi:MAG: response regulator [Candidatus Aminicenantaceae bacterium]
MASILVIEDDEQIRALLKQILERAGHEVLEAPDGNKGLRIYRKNLPDLIITDIIMPEKDGLETIRELRKMNPDVKIIAVSGGGFIHSDYYLDMAKRFGAFSILAKPFTPAEVLNAVNQLLQKGEIR